MNDTLATPIRSYPSSTTSSACFLGFLPGQSPPTFLAKRIIVTILYHAAYAYALYTTSHVYVTWFASDSQRPTASIFMDVLYVSLTPNGVCPHLGRPCEWGRSRVEYCTHLGDCFAHVSTGRCLKEYPVYWVSVNLR